VSRQDLVDLYEAYIATCNRHAVSELGEFVQPRLSVNGRPRTLSEYAADVGAVFEAVPDYAWTVEHLVVEEPWISVRLSDRGTHRGPWLGQPPTGRTVATDEFAMYRVEDGRIAEVWSVADNARLLEIGTD
jgi:predicted ester cyclase